jgi:hypothetical protein
MEEPMNPRLKVIALSLGLFLLTSAPLGLAQQEKGDKEIAVSGNFDVPNSDPSTANGTVAIRFGDYITRNSIIGVDSLTFVTKDSQLEFVDVFGRRLIPTKNPKLFPFFGGSGGLSLYHNSGTEHNFLAKGEVGVKYFLSQRFAFEVAYDLQYVRTPGQSFADSSDSVVTFGFSYLFGKPKR